MTTTNLSATAADYQRVISLQSKEIADADLKISILVRMVDENKATIDHLTVELAALKNPAVVNAPDMLMQTNGAQTTT